MAAKGQAWVLAAAILLSGPVQAADCTPAGLHWMQGAWKYSDRTRANREQWTATAGGRLIGVTWSEQGTKDVVQLTIILNERGKLILRQRHFDTALSHAMQDRDDPVVFAATTCGTDFVAFQGLGVWADSRLSYKRVGANLDLEGYAPFKGRPGHYHVVFTRE